MSHLRQWTGAAAVLLLLAPAGCGRAPEAQNAGTSAPATSSAPTAAPPDAASDPDGGGPRNSFIVCPGNPRCPKSGSQDE